jgi:hypothetical protein
MTMGFGRSAVAAMRTIGCKAVATQKPPHFLKESPVR